MYLKRWVRIVDVLEVLKLARVRSTCSSISKRPRDGTESGDDLTCTPSTAYWPSEKASSVPGLVFTSAGHRWTHRTVQRLQHVMYEAFSAIVVA